MHDSKWQPTLITQSNFRSSKSKTSHLAPLSTATLHLAAIISAGISWPIHYLLAPLDAEGKGRATTCRRPIGAVFVWVSAHFEFVGHKLEFRWLWLSGWWPLVWVQKKHGRRSFGHATIQFRKDNYHWFIPYEGPGTLQRPDQRC
jgi:hypothetical protein